jgi:hypothetical protein
VKSSKWKSVFIIHKQDMVGVSVYMVAVSVALACFVGGFDARSVLALRMYAWRVILCLKRWVSMTFKDHPISKRIFGFCTKNWMTRAWFVGMF